MSSQEAIETEFQYLDEKVDREITVYLMGGGAMTFRELKNATRDLDLLVTARSDFEMLHDILRDRGYEIVESPVEEYESLGAALMLDKESECRFDIFDWEVLRELRLSNEMKERASVVFEGTNLRVRALNNEDIFLSTEESYGFSCWRRSKWVSPPRLNVRWSVLVRVHRHYFISRCTKSNNV